MTPLDPVPGSPAKSKGDLGTRTLSAIVMVAVAGTALWLGGWVFTGFVVAVGLGVLWEWWGLVQRIAANGWGKAVWIAAGAAYIAVAMATLYRIRVAYDDLWWTGALLGVVVAIDIGAYFCGRAIGGPKIAPGISPNKTWAGLLGGIIGATLFLGWWSAAWPEGTGIDQSLLIHVYNMLDILPLAAAAAVVAQAGDFFESWMKRRAGVKDSGRLIPGHGGLFDRVDGTLAILAAFALLMVWRSL